MPPCSRAPRARGERAHQLLRPPVTTEVDIALWKDCQKTLNVSAGVVPVATSCRGLVRDRCHTRAAIGRAPLAGLRAVARPAQVPLLLLKTFQAQPHHRMAAGRGGVCTATPRDGSEGASNSAVIARHRVRRVPQGGSAPAHKALTRSPCWAQAAEGNLNNRLHSLCRWPQDFQALLISAPETADLLDPASWTATAPLAFDDAWLSGVTPVVPSGGFLEGGSAPGDKDGSWQKGQHLLLWRPCLVFDARAADWFLES